MSTQERAEIANKYPEASAEANEAYLNGKLKMNARQFADMEAFFLRAIALGHKGATNDLAFYHHHVTQKRDEAERLYKLAADLGNANAAFNLGMLLYEHKDQGAAVDWFQRAAAAGDDRATFSLAVHHERRGDLDKAEAYYRESADKAANPKSLVALGDIRRLHRSDTAGAKQLYFRALRLGHGNAVYSFEHLDLTDAEKSEMWRLFQATLGQQ